MPEVDIAALVASLPDLKRQRDAAARRLADAQRELSALDEIIGGIGKLASRSDQQIAFADDIARQVVEANSRGIEVVSAAPIRGREAVRELLADGRPWKQGAIVSEIKRRGWIKPDSRNPDSAIRETVRRMAQLGELKRLGGGVYQLADSVGEIRIRGVESG